MLAQHAIEIAKLFVQWAQMQKEMDKYTKREGLKEN